MHMHEGTTDFLKMLLVALVAIGFIAWLHIYFSPSIALIAIALVAGTIFFIGGSILSSYIQKNTLNQVAQFTAKDATVDRYRMQTMKEMVRGEVETQKANAYRVKTDEQIRLLEARQQYKQLPNHSDQSYNEESTFWEINDTVDLEDWN